MWCDVGLWSFEIEMLAIVCRKSVSVVRCMLRERLSQLFVSLLTVFPVVVSSE